MSTCASLLSHILGLDEISKGMAVERRGEWAPQAVFEAQQTILSNIMVVSALLLGFIVTGTLLSMSLTGYENFNITDLIHFFELSALAAMLSFLSLVTSFLTSVWGANFMTTLGPNEAAKALTQGSVLRHIIAEGSLYMSMFFFIVSLNQYVNMVYSGPDICASYRGPASICGRAGQDLYFAAKPYCSGKCALEKATSETECSRSADKMECLCLEFCLHERAWEAKFNWTQNSIDRVKTVSVRNYHFFGYRPFNPISKPARTKVINAAVSLMCQHAKLEAAKESCFLDKTRDCNRIYMAWEEAEICLENNIQEADRCTKVCSWSDETPPREALEKATRAVFIPLSCMVILLTLGRIIVIIARAARAFLVGARQKDEEDGDDSSE